jgi:hypothetical protein
VRKVGLAGRFRPAIGHLVLVHETLLRVGRRRKAETAASEGVLETLPGGESSPNSGAALEKLLLLGTKLVLAELFVQRFGASAIWSSSASPLPLPLPACLRRHSQAANVSCFILFTSAVALDVLRTATLA